MISFNVFIISSNSENSNDVVIILQYFTCLSNSLKEKALISGIPKNNRMDSMVFFGYDILYLFRIFKNSSLLIF